VFGVSLLTPWGIHLFSAGFARLRARTRKAETLLVDLTRASGKNSVAVASLTIAVGMLVSVSIMVASFRSTMETWIGRTLRADLYVSPVVRFIGNRAAVLPKSLPGLTSGTEGVLAVDAFRTRRVAYRDWPVRLGAGDLRVVRDHGGLSFLSGNRREILNRALRNEEVLVSEVFSNRFGLETGDEFSLATAEGPKAFRIAGVFYDYSTEGGLIILSRDLYSRLWKDDRVSTLAVYLTSGADPEAVKEALASSFGTKSGAAVFENRRLRRHILRIFDQTFAITYALEAIALAVAILGMIKALLTNVLDRTREIGLLRAIGFDRRQIFGWVIREAAAMGIIANILGALSGGGLALILIFVIHKQSFGWTIQPHWPPAEIIGYLVLILGAAVGAAFWPARVAANVEVKEAIRFE
jgi:putative ABC transport system permease protein